MLSSTSIRNLIETQNLITGYIDLDTQLQQNGIDLTVRNVSMLGNAAVTTITERERIGPTLVPVDLHNGLYFLNANTEFTVTLNERVKLPTNIAALVRPRSTIIRFGHSIHTAVWDAGYEGNSTILLRTGNRPLELGENARVAQMVFFELDNETVAYAGKYQGEK